MRGLRTTSLLAVALTYALIVLGGVVRTTDSGLACPDWPTCYGQWVLTPADFAALPPTGYSYAQVMLEWVHRFIAGGLLGPVVLVLAVQMWRQRAVASGLPRAAFLLLALLLLQGALGGLTVLDRNSPWSVALHLGNALLVLATLLWITAQAGPVPTDPRPRGALPLAGLAWGLALLTMVTAAMTAKAGASLACAAWPTCHGALLPDLGDPLVRIHVAHRLLAATVGLATLGLYGVTRHSSPRLRQLATGAVLLCAWQIGLGALVIIFQVPVWQAVLHQATGVLTFGVLTVLLWSMMRRAIVNGRGGRGVGEGYGFALQRP